MPLVFFLCPYTGTGGECGVTDECSLGVCQNDACEGCGEELPEEDYCPYWINESLDGPCGWYWSVTRVTGNANYVWAVNFVDAAISRADTVSPDEAYLWVRCVKGRL